MQSAEFKYNKHLFLDKAKKWTQEHAVQKNTVSAFVPLNTGSLIWLQKPFGL